ncbi:TetR/AcrR family transcriptional regulator [Actinoplanes sp. TBRC 11911]|uniref:TetR/AcrR family transcriptional regulator n=1 Tax=Actinoplanes sp. TBRC 11911 TaxID=2729386 RepID=UPI00145F68BD|nr:TetR/AcrR family transcriptional regulator [Actinoplanes sp. TBRC 11911]NMO55089.1 TetR/AcrR family transcriptional regulator [Actinoplanes sp. TBRC 11911]
MRIPTTAKGRQTMAGITAAAARLMHDRGITATSLDDVLAASGAGKSQLYHYFGDKEGLTQAVFRLQLDRILANQQSLSDPSCDDLTRWRDEVLAALRASDFGMCPLGTFAGQVGDSSVLRATLSDLFEEWRLALAALVRRAAGAGHVVAGVDPDEAATCLLAALEGGTMLANLQHDEAPLRTMLDAELARLTR